MNVRTIADLNATIVAELPRIPTDVDLVVGVPRSGLLAATMVALHLNLPLTDVDGVAEHRLFRTGKRPLRSPAQEGLLSEPSHILVVDDVVSAGAELRRVRTELEALATPHRYTFLAVYGFPGGSDRADLILEEVPRPMVFEWSFLHSTALDKVCLDIDGVLCVDPTPEQDDGGEGYERFVREARPLFLPTAQARALVTAREERYRAMTEEWLATNGVRYEKLLMMPDGSRQASDRHARVAAFKAAAYRESGAILFVESNPGLADRIAQLSGRPVLALSDNAVLQPNLAAKLRLRVQRLRWWLRRSARAPRKLVRVLRRRVGRT